MKQAMWKSGWKLVLQVGACALAMMALTAEAAVTTTSIKPGDKYYVGKNEECVIYARRFQPKLPTGLVTAAAKQKIINSYTPKAGRVAIMSIGPVWHVAYVVTVDDSGSSRSINVAEHNIPLGTKTPRYRKATCGSKISDCEKALSIVGYFKP